MSEPLTLVQQEQAYRVRSFRRDHKINRWQIKTMKAAGFRIDDIDICEDWVVWRRGDLRIEVYFLTPVTPKSLVELVVQQTRYWVIAQMRNLAPEEMKL
jgi:hypothetical protein